MKKDLEISAKLTPAKQFGLLLILLFVGFLFTVLAQAGIAAANPAQRTLLLAGSACQGVLAFMFPSLAVALLNGSREGMRSIGLSSAPKCVAILTAALVYFASLPALNQLIDWNANMQLPSWMQSIYEQMKAWEDSAEELTQSLLSVKSVGGLIINVLIIGCLTGLAEETFFRGGIQRLLIQMTVGPHIAIWITAIIFSTMHFQFFGFVPRMILGALFGYLYYWTGSLWVSAFAHALNNSMAVIIAWLTANEYITYDLDSIGVASGSFPWMALLSLSVTLVILYQHKTLLPKKG